MAKGKPAKLSKVERGNIPNATNIPVNTKILPENHGRSLVPV